VFRFSLTRHVSQDERAVDFTARVGVDGGVGETEHSSVFGHGIHFSANNSGPSVFADVPKRVFLKGV
tara:strand:- start:446 stop:646 length:201 start_codon:yes stop_codon:yes gene_type:complete